MTFRMESFDLIKHPNFVSVKYLRGDGIHSLEVYMSVQSQTKQKKKK